MGINSTEVAYMMGQMGTAMRRTAGATYEPPAGKMIVAIQVVKGTARFDILTPINDGVRGTTSANAMFVSTDASASGVDSVDALHGTNNQHVVAGSANGTQFAEGITFFGRYSKVKLANSATIIMYLADKPKKY